MTFIDWIALTGQVTGIIVSLGAIKWVNKKYIHYKKNREAVKAVQDEITKRILEKLRAIEAEVKPNSGSSLNDKITSFGGRLDLIDKRLEDIKIEARINTEILDVAIWESDAKGRVTYVSITLCEIIGCTQSDLLDSSWVGFIDKDDRKRVIDEWYYAVENASEFNIEYNYRKSDGTYQRVKAIAIHMKDKEGNVLKTLGRVTKIGEPFTKNN